MDADYHRVSTAETHERTLLDYLAARSSRGRRRGADPHLGKKSLDLRNPEDSRV